MKRIITQTLSIVLLVSAVSPVFAGIAEIKAQLAAQGLDASAQPKACTRTSAAPVVERPTTIDSSQQVAGLQLAQVLKGSRTATTTKGQTFGAKLAEQHKNAEKGEGAVTVSTRKAPASKVRRPKGDTKRSRATEKQETQSYWSLLNSYKYHIAATVVGSYALYKGYKWINS